MNSLKGAFAPSIWGVFLTIISVLIFSYYLRNECLPTKLLLDDITLTKWIPQLYPTTSQKLQESLITSERQLQRNMEAAQKVAEFAASIKDEAGMLVGNVSQANLGLQRIAEQSNQIEQFYNSVNSLTSFQGELKDLYEQINQQSSTFQLRTIESLNRLDDFVHNMSTNLDSQNQQMQGILTALKLYEQGYMNYRNEFDGSTRELLNSIIDAVAQIESRNKDLIKELGEPLNNLLYEQLATMQKEQANNWVKILERFNSMNVPMERAALTIENAFENITKRSEAINRELQHQYAKQSEDSTKHNAAIIQLLSKITGDLTGGKYATIKTTVSEPIEELTIRRRIRRMFKIGGRKVG